MGAIKRIYIYQKEMLPFLKNALLSVVLFAEIYFYIVLTSDVGMFTLGAEEFVCFFTIFTFFLSLRIADDLKDIKTDLKLFPDRPIPSGRTKKKDIIALLIVFNVTSIVLNIVFMREYPYYFIGYAILIGYGILMSVWFFARAKIQPNLILALITHNPIGVIINSYIIVLTCLKYGVAIFTLDHILLALTLYWPTLIWEISRKVRAPKDETEYITYSKLYGYKKITLIIIAVMTIDVITSMYLMFKLWYWGIPLIIAAYVWFVITSAQFYKNPQRFKLVKKVEIYEIITEIPMILIQTGLIIFMAVS